MQISGGGGTSSLNPQLAIARPTQPLLAETALRPTEAAPARPAPRRGTGDIDATGKGDMAKAASVLHDSPSFTQVAGKNTCAAANHERNLLEQAPDLHAKMLKELKRDGHTTMPNGQELHLSEKNAEYIDKQPGTEAERGAMRIQAAMMDYANRHQPYDLESDLSGKDQKGLSVEQTQRLDALDESCKTVTNQQIQGGALAQDVMSTVATIFTLGMMANTESHSDRVVDQVSKQLEAIGEDNQALVMNLALQADGMLHSVRIDEISEDGAVTISDTRGSMTLDADAFAKAAQDDDGNSGDDTGMATTTTTPTGGGTRRR